MPFFIVIIFLCIKMLAIGRKGVYADFFEIFVGASA